MSICALVAACDFNKADYNTRWKAGKFDCVIAVDGGYAHLQSVGCTPDIALGDFDSLGYVPKGLKVEQHPTHKDKSDLELAFDYVSEHGFSKVVAYGARGGRLDHTMANLQICARFAEKGMDVELVDLDSVVSILVGPGTLKLPARKTGVVSVFSAVDLSHGVSERGLVYPLDNASLPNRTTLGLSNEFIGEAVTISVERGTLFVFHP